MSLDKFASFEEWAAAKQVLAWPAEVADPGTCGTITLTESPLALLNAADKTEVETQLNALAAKIDALLACRS